MSEAVYKAARHQRDMADTEDLFEDVEKFGALLRLGTSGALKSRAGQGAMTAGREAKKFGGALKQGGWKNAGQTTRRAWGNLTPTGKKVVGGTAAGVGTAGLGGAGLLGSKLDG